MRKIAVLFIGLSFSIPSIADVYRKIDPTTGHVTYTNIPPGSANAAAPRSEQKTISNPSPRKLETDKNTPANFPKISAADQKARDSDKRKILEDELKNEQGFLQAAISKKSDQDTQNRHHKNIEAIQREINLIK